MTVQSIPVKALRPTQIAVGQQLVRMKRKGLRERERKPQELVDYILANPIRVVAGPNAQVFIIDHHHLECALLKEGFKTAPVEVEDDLSKLSLVEFGKEMERRKWVYAFNGRGRACKISDIPTKLVAMEDDPCRSLAGFVRLDGGFAKTQTPYVEFQWANYFRPLFKLKVLKQDFRSCVRKAKVLASAPAAAHLPGFIAAA
jgi:hypothetical protein